jgi:hypothetical protein
MKSGGFKGGGSQTQTDSQPLNSSDSQWYFKDLGLLSPQTIEGHDVSPTTVDFNADGIPDYLGGAEDGHFYYLRNPRTK